MATTTAGPERTANSYSVPSTVLLDFFHETTEQLKRNTQLQDPSAVAAAEAAAGGGDNDHSYRTGIPTSLEEQRRLLLRIQLDALEGTLVHYNGEATSSNGREVTLLDAQTALRQLGSQDFEHISLEIKNADNDAEEGERELLDASAAMNDAARLAFARSVLHAELDWDRRVGDDFEESNQIIEKAEERRGLRDGAGEEGSEETMSRDAIIEFCGLCTAAVGLEEVQAYLRHGTDMTVSMNTGGDGTTADQKLDWRERSDGTTMPPERMERLHRLLFRAVGYRAQFAKAKVQRIFFPSDVLPEEGTGADPELDDAFGNFLTATSVAATKAAVGTSGSGGGGGGGGVSTGDGFLSDRDAGGVTRVVSVQYTEREIITPGENDGSEPSSSSVVPPVQSMDQRDEDRQRQQLAMARETAAMQRGILEELLSMDVDKRDAMLKEAKEANDAFLKRALELPAGQERLEFLQSIDPERQRLLAMHKLWESYLASRE